MFAISQISLFEIFKKGAFINPIVGWHLRNILPSSIKECNQDLGVSISRQDKFVAQPVGGVIRHHMGISGKMFWTQLRLAQYNYLLTPYDALSPLALPSGYITNSMQILTKSLSTGEFLVVSLTTEFMLVIQLFSHFYYSELLGSLPHSYFLQLILLVYGLFLIALFSPSF